MQASNCDEPQVVAAVSFLNTRPLIDALESDRTIRLVRAVPSHLGALLQRRQAACALLPVIDLHRMGVPMRILPAGCIGSDGETLTVRVFSRTAPEKVRQLVVDADSHTSVVLASVIWAEMFGQTLELVPNPLPSAPEDAAVLMIGDKVVTHAPKDYPYQVDLGEAWRRLTGLPFVFAVWAARADEPRKDSAQLGAALLRARQRSAGRIGEIAQKAGPEHGWPAELAQKYLTQHIRYEFGPTQRRGMEEFFRLAHKHGLIDCPADIEYIDLPQ